MASARLKCSTRAFDSCAGLTRLACRPTLVMFSQSASSSRRPLAAQCRPNAKQLGTHRSSPPENSLAPV
eukprot:3366398-Prymnesium_polylepis.2